MDNEQGACVRFKRAGNGFDMGVTRGKSVVQLDNVELSSSKDGVLKG